MVKMLNIPTQQSTATTLAGPKVSKDQEFGKKKQTLRTLRVTIQLFASVSLSPSHRSNSILALENAALFFIISKWQRRRTFFYIFEKKIK